MDAFEKAERRAELERAIAAGEQALPILEARADAAAQAEAAALAPYEAARAAMGAAWARHQHRTDRNINIFDPAAVAAAMREAVRADDPREAYKEAEAALRAAEPALIRARARATAAAQAVGEQRRRLGCWRTMLEALDAPPTPPPPRTGFRWLSWSGV